MALTIEALGEAVIGSTSEPPTRAQSTRARKVSHMHVACVQCRLPLHTGHDGTNSDTRAL